MPKNNSKPLSTRKMETDEKKKKNYLKKNKRNV